MTRSDERSCCENAGESSIITNCVETAASTVTRYCSIAASTVSGVKRAHTMHGTPTMAGEKCAVHSPKPNGAGSALRKTSSGVNVATSAAKPWNANQRAWSCMTIFGRPVVPDVEFKNHSSSGPIASSTAGADARGLGCVGVARGRRCARRGARFRARRRARRCRPRRALPSRTRASPACTEGPSAILSATRSPGA